jgi:hypothetical protein
MAARRRFPASASPVPLNAGGESDQTAVGPQRCCIDVPQRVQHSQAIARPMQRCAVCVLDNATAVLSRERSIAVSTGAALSQDRGSVEPHRKTDVKSGVQRQKLADIEDDTARC